jgi:flagellar hook-length control protein FliK
MSILSVFNQTVTELLPSRSVEPTTHTEKPGGFDRELKDADARMDRPKTADDTPRNTPATDKPEPKDQPAAATDKAGSDKQDQPVKESEPVTDESSQTTDNVEVTDDADAAATDTVTTAEGQAAPTQTEATTTAAANAQLVEQVTTALSAETASTAVQSEQANTVTNAQATQQVVAQVDTDASTSKAAVEQASTPVLTNAQPQQAKTDQSQQTDNTKQGEPTASAERVAFVSESRQEDARQATADDAGKQQQSALQGEGKAQANNAAQTFNSTSTTTTTVDAAAAGARPFAAVESPSPTGAATAQAGPTAQTTDNTQLNTARISRGMQNAIMQKGGSVTLRLTPPEMGTVRIQLQINNGTVNATFHAETESTRTMLNQQLSQLRTALEHQGLGVERLGVQTMQPSSNTSMQQDAGSERDGQPNDGRSRGGFTHQGGRQDQRSDTNEQQQAFDQELTNAA